MADDCENTTEEGVEMSTYVKGHEYQSRTGVSLDL